MNGQYYLAALPTDGTRGNVHHNRKKGISMRNTFTNTVSIAKIDQVRPVGLIFGELNPALFSDSMESGPLSGAFGLLVMIEPMDTKDIFRTIDPRKIMDGGTEFVALDVTSMPDTEYAATIVNAGHVDELAHAFHTEKLAIEQSSFDGSETTAVILVLGTNASRDIAKLVGTQALHADERLLVVVGWRATTVVKNLTKGRDIVSGDRVRDIYASTMTELFSRQGGLTIDLSVNGPSQFGAAEAAPLQQAAAESDMPHVPAE